MGLNRRLSKRRLERVCTRNLLVAIAAGGVVALPAMAGMPPTGEVKKAAAKSRLAQGPGGGVAAIPFNDNFDSYTVGQGIDGLGGWQVWAPGSPDGVIVNSEANSDPNALQLQAGTDLVQAGHVEGGVWELSAMTYFPSSSNNNTGGYLIGLNTWASPAGPYHWSADMGFDVAGFPNVVVIQEDPTVQAPLLLDQWVEARMVIDLDNDTYDAFYGSTQLVNDRPWSTGWSAGGQVAIEAIDFYSSGVVGMLFDDVSLEEIGAGCYPDCDGDTVLSIDDFVCFQTFFAFGDPYADCDGDTVLSIDDFVCFQTFFAFGCP
jgi:hypothetical protein